MTTTVAAIQTQRLRLVSMTPAFLEASLTGRSADASTLLGADICPDWFDEQWLMRLRLDDLRGDPSLQPWLLRAVILGETNTMIGHIGFHTAPDPAYLRDFAPGGIEIGYTIFATYRAQGYATEACRGLMDWAHTQHHLNRFILSISPENTPSLRIAHRLGFIRIGEHVDPEDGIEYIFAHILGEIEEEKEDEVKRQSAKGKSG
ncbi:MAG: GNAT family N-acetyltransferase [Caldilineaceae bacterium]